MVTLIIILVILGAILIPCVRIVPQTQVYIIERLGKYHATWGAGFHVKAPIIDVCVSKVSLKERVVDFPPQGVITKDNVAMHIDSVVYMTVTDPKLYTYGVDNPIAGVENLSATTLRNVIGQMELDESLSGRDEINSKLEAELDAATDKWGIKVNRVEVKTIQPPKEILDVMSKQMKAERERRQAVLEAEAHQESIVKRAEGDKKAKILAAEAERDAQIALAEGKAKSIALVYEAEAEGMRKLNDAQPEDRILKLKSIQAMKDIANGNSTKIFMPTDMMSQVGALGVIGEALDLAHTTNSNKKEKLQKIVEQDACLHDESSKISKEAYQQQVNTQGYLEDVAKGIEPAFEPNVE